MSSRSPPPCGLRDLAQEAARLELALAVRDRGEPSAQLRAQIQDRGTGAVAERPEQGGLPAPGGPTSRTSLLCRAATSSTSRSKRESIVQWAPYPLAPSALPGPSPSRGSALWRLIHASMSAREKRQVPPTLKAGIFLAPARR